MIDARFYWHAFPVRTAAELLGTLALTWATWSLTQSVRAVACDQAGRVRARARARARVRARR